MEWLGWAILLAQILVLGAYRYYAGKWPLRLDL
ncbi:MAG: hypothetical protein GHHEDOFH_02011 [Pseudorhodoplanes sp.]|nr:hypothetical protein [Pseudorhodoplanes sp.]